MSRFLVLVVLGLFGAGSGQAQDPHAQATARLLFHEGLEHADAEDWGQAEDCFERAQTLRPAAPIALNLGIAREHLGELVAASEAFRYVIRDESANASMQRRARTHLDAILPRLGELVIEVEGPREGTTMLLDDREISLATVGVANPVDPGSHVVRVVRDGTEVARSIAEIQEGDARTLRLVIPEPDIPASDTPDTVELDLQVHTDSTPGVDVPDETRPWFRRGWVWTIVGIVVGAVIGGSVAAVRRSGGSQSVCDDLVLGCIEP